MASLISVSRRKIMAYGGLATPLAMIGYPIAIWLIPFYSEVTKFQLALLADLLLIARLTDVITAAMSSGRYVYDVLLTDGSGDKTRVLEGQAILTPGVSRV